MSERRQSVRRSVHYDDVKATLDQQGICQAQLCRALRALAKELRSRLGVWSSQASEEVLERIEETLLTSTEKEKATPAEDLRGFHGEGQMCVSPAAPPPSCVEIPAGSDDEAPRAADPMAFGKYPMHAEVKAFQRQSQQTEALRREVASLRKALETSATDFQQMAEDAATSAAQNAESLLRSAERGLTEKFQAAVDHALDQREHLSFLARDAVEDRLRRELRAYSEVTDESLEALRGSLAQKSQKWEQEAQRIDYRMNLINEQMGQVSQVAQERSEAATLLVSAALADFRMGELRDQANALRELRHCAAGVARGVLRLGQVLARRRFLASFRRQRRQAWQQPKAAEIGSVMYCDMAIMSATWAKLG
ncbi:unnamed protein product [Effrenium voratum]|uniref:Uncharacterized protein n=1 Tax=Effrenium voratum TaxID=2562239 RepID=A0AA36N0T1_9DINO|nr:unnamed protein product [Effrenium voratum]